MLVLPVAGSVGSAVARSRFMPISRRLTGWLLGLFAVASLVPSAAVATAHPQTAFPLPESEYGVRDVCPRPSPGHFSCLALELQPRSATARSHTRPLGVPVRAQSAAGSAAEVCEHATAAEGCYGLRPQDLHSAYELPTSAPSEQTIAIVDAYNDPDVEADLGVYDEAFGLPDCTHANGCFTKVNQEGAAAPLPEAEGGWAVEIALDVETAHAICQNCRIVLVEANNNGPYALGEAENTAATLGANEITNSWGAPEPLPVSESLLKHPGIVITASAGDDGYDNWLVEPTLADRGDYPAAYPFVIGVGGTRLDLTTGGARVGETVWNGDGAGGSGCSFSYEAPRWQQEVPDWPVGCEHRRAVADVSADADPYTGVAVYDSYSLVERTKGHKEPFGWGTVGGTSLGSPLIAATFALAGGADGVAYPAESLYERVLSETNRLHEVVSGSNGECSSYNHETGLASCSIAEEAKSCRNTPICLAGPGYSGPTGLGTPEGIGAFQAAPAPLRAEQTVQITSSPSSPPTVDGPAYELQAKASTGLPITFTSLATQAIGLDVCTVTGAEVTFHAKGECPLEARQVGNSTYLAATEMQHLHVLGITQTIKFTTTPPSPASAGESFSVNAVSSAGFDVEYATTTPSVCSTDTDWIYLAAGGTCTIVATARGDYEYEEGRAEQTIQVLKNQQQISLSPPPSTARVGGAPYAFSAEARSGLPVSLSIVTPAVCKFEDSSQAVAFLRPGTCTIEANQAGDSYWEAAPQVEQSFQVSKALQQISFQKLPPSDIVLGEGPFSAGAVSSSGLPVELSSATPSTCIFEKSEVHLITAGTCTIDANQSGSSYYEEALIEDSFTIAKRSQVVHFLTGAPTSVTVGGTPYLITAEASSGLPVSFSAGGHGVCEATGGTIYFVGAGTCVINASQEGNREFAAAPNAQQSITVLAPPITPTAPSSPLSPLIHLMPNSQFHLLHTPNVNQASGAITFSAAVTQAGTFRWSLTFPDVSIRVPSANKSKCRDDHSKLHGACRPRALTFGTGTLAVDSTTASSGIVSFTVPPSDAARSALHKAPALRRHLTITAAISFQSSLGGAPLTHRYSIADRLRR